MKTNTSQNTNKSESDNFIKIYILLKLTKIIMFIYHLLKVNQLDKYLSFIDNFLSPIDIYWCLLKFTNKKIK